MISKIHANVLTADQLWALPDDGNRYELIVGILHMMSPAGNEHGRVAMAIGASLFQHVKTNGLGRTYAAETGFRIGQNPDTVRAADAAYVSFQSLAKTVAHEGYLDLAPDLVVEVVAPNDGTAQIESKVSQWLSVGCRLVLVADPAKKCLRVYREPAQVETLHVGDRFDSGSVCKNWRLPVDEVFE